MENPTNSFRELELMKEKRGHSLYRLFCLNEFFLTYVFCLNV